MPNHVESMIAWKLMRLVVQRLGNIQRALGYNTDPFVSMDWSEVQNSDKTFALYVECLSHNAVEHEVGGNHGPRCTMVLSLMIAGFAQVETGIPRQMAMMLEQDAREALHTIATDIHALTGRGANFSWGDCTHDAGALAADKEASFTLFCSFTYKQSAGW